MEQQKHSGNGGERGITITVSDPQVRKEYGGARQYYLYSLKGEDAKGPIAIQRRYSDFDSIRALLVKRWPGCYIPSLPSKVKLAHSDEQFLETRSKYLQKFLWEVARKPFLWESDQMQIFLRNDMLDLDKVLSPLSKIDPAEVLYRFNSRFAGVAVQGAMQVRIQNFSSYLKTLYLKVQQLRNRSEQINTAQQKYQKKYSKFLLNVLASYQEKFLQYYNRDNPAFSPIFSTQQNAEKKTELEESLKEAPLRVLFEELKREKREIFAMQEAIQQYDDYIAQKGRIQAKIKEHQIKIGELKAGRQSFLSKIRSLSTENEVSAHQKAIEKYKSELDIYTELCQVMTRVLLVSQIESFKEERTSSYYKMVKQIAQQQLKIIEKERDFWLAVTNNAHLDFEIEDMNHSKVKENPPVKVQKQQVKKQEKPSEQQVKKEEKIDETQLKQQTKPQKEQVIQEEKEKVDKEQVTEKTKSVGDSPQRQKSNESPEEATIANDNFQQMQEVDAEIKNSNINIDVQDSPRSQTQPKAPNPTPQKTEQQEGKAQVKKQQ